MLPADLPGYNVLLGAGEGQVMDEKWLKVGAFFGEQDAHGYPYWVTLWKPSREDIEAIIRTGEIYVKLLGTRQPAMTLFTLDEEGKQNI